GGTGQIRPCTASPAPFIASAGEALPTSTAWTCSATADSIWAYCGNCQNGFGVAVAVIRSVNAAVNVSPATESEARAVSVVGGRDSWSKKSITVASSEVIHWANSAAVSAPSPSTTAITWPHSWAHGSSPALSTGRAIGSSLLSRSGSGESASTALLPTTASS